MQRMQPHELDCFTTRDEMMAIARAHAVAQLAEVIKNALANPMPPIPKSLTTNEERDYAALMKNEALWRAGKKDEWLRAEIMRIKNRK